jgi:ATP-dependent RNA helicase RhlE
VVDLSQVEIFVLDEADRMLDMGFFPDVRRILALLPSHRQNLLFSATFSQEIKALAQKILQEPELVEVARLRPAAELIEQKVYRVARDRKSELLTHLILEHNWYQVLVFTRTKHGADRLSKYLSQRGISALSIHGNKSQSARTQTLAKFKSGNLQVLVATDIAARGIDINELPMVINFDLPNVPEDYVHRIGRTGRAGTVGEALSLVCVDEEKFLADIEKLMQRSVPQSVVPGFEPNTPSPNTPAPNPRQGKSAQPEREKRGNQGAKTGYPRGQENASGRSFKAPAKKIIAAPSPRSTAVRRKPN